MRSTKNMLVTVIFSAPQLILCCLVLWKWMMERHWRDTARLNPQTCVVWQVRTTFTDVDSATLYDVLHDPDFRKTWDQTMLEGAEICAINPNNDIGYYASKVVLVFFSFVSVSMWHETDNIFGSFLILLSSSWPFQLRKQFYWGTHTRSQVNTTWPNQPDIRYLADRVV